jgi:ribosomal protein L24
MIRKGSQVQWNWGKGHGQGKVTETYHEDVEKQINGATIKRKASPTEPAYLIQQDDGSEVLKSASEVHKLS